MRKCPFCGKENSEEKYYCEDCDSYLGSKHPEGPPPEASDKAKQRLRPVPAKQKIVRPRKAPEYVKLYHGGYVKRSTYNWLQKKNADASRTMFVILGIMLFFALLKGCN